MAKDKERLDVLLVNRGLATSREKAKSLIMAGEVFVNGQREDKPGTTFPMSAEADLNLKRQLIILAFPLKEKCAWILEPPLADLRTVCCRTAPLRYIP